MDRFSLQTFIKICLRDSGGRISEIQKKLDSNGGYDFYNSFYRAVRSFSDGKDAEGALAILAAPSKDVERKHNLAAFESFRDKFGNSRTLEAIKEPAVIVPEGANFEISIDPLFGVEKSGNKFAYLPWAIREPDLTQRYAAVACLVMRQAYKGTNLSNWQFNVFDLNKRKSYSENQISENTPRILAMDVRTISNLISEL